MLLEEAELGRTSSELVQLTIRPDHGLLVGEFYQASVKVGERNVHERRHLTPQRRTAGVDRAGGDRPSLPALLHGFHRAAPRGAHLSADLEPTSSQLLWIVDIYGFLLAGFLITMGLWATGSGAGGCC